MKPRRRIRAPALTAVLLLALAPGAASASGPSPQPAPATTPSSAPSPDPAPQAAPTPTPTHSSQAATHSTVSAPRSRTVITPSAAPAAPALRVSHPRVLLRTVARRARPPAHRRRARPVHPAHHKRTAPVVAHTAVPVTHHVVRAAPAHRSGLTLAVGAAVLLVLVGISLALMRRVARLHRETTIGTAA
jgi:hypothetical protein